METLKHECGVALVRLLKPLDYYQEKYGTWMWGLNKLYLLMEKQHNRGQEGAGIASVKLHAEPGTEYMFRERALGSGAITEVFGNINAAISEHTALHPNGSCPYGDYPFAAELYMGHLRYSTTGQAGISYVHPFLRRNNWRAKNIALCGNFNMTNGSDIFQDITRQGQHPRRYADTYIMLEQVGHRLDREAERLFQESLLQGHKDTEITDYIDNNINIANVLGTSAPMWDGGYVVCGLTGSGEAFAIRDPWGIRPAFTYQDDEVVVVASERPVIQTAFDLEAEQIRELNSGEALMVSKAGVVRREQIIEPKQQSPCSFERIYFSRGSDKDIYKERKTLGRQLVEPVLEAVDNDIDNTVFSFIPNTSEVAYFGMLDGFEDYLNKKKIEAISAPIFSSEGELHTTPDGKLSAATRRPDKADLEAILSRRIRYEKVAIKDIKLRTFIAESNARNDLAAHVYDITYGSIVAGQDNLVVIDDSIVRGTTLQQSIIKILDRLSPKKIVIVSSAPQVRYPDYYGIDMPNLDELIAFRAAVALLAESGRSYIIDDVYKKVMSEDCSEINHVKAIYEPFTDKEISAKIVQMLTPAGTRAEVELVFQTIEGLHAACPNHKGDWYFSGNFPTRGGTRAVNNAFIKYHTASCSPHGQLPM